MSSLIAHAHHAAATVGHHLHQTAGHVGSHVQTTTDRLLPPKQREQKIKDLRAFSARNPKLATFIAVQTGFLGIPILLFLAFAIATLLISLATGLLVAISTAFVCTGVAVGIALFFLVPTLFFASFVASSFFLWGLVVYLVLQRFNEGEAPGKPGTKVGDKIHGLTGGRLDWLVDAKDEGEARTSEAQGAPRVNGSLGQRNDAVGYGTQGDKPVNGTRWESKWEAMGLRPHSTNADGQEVKVDTIVRS
ncbi:hypothetical protein ACEQ8H_000443 [Pleosporales sp. CAS-2024a]